MMKEVLTRRFKRLLKEDPDRAQGHWPDLLLIDGGAGQVSAVAGIMREMGVADIPMVGVAKGVDRDHGKEEFHRTGKRPMALRRGDPVLYFVQRLRDEAHRFAIGTHRAKRAKSMSATPLDEVPGVGAARKRALLAHFGSAKAVSRANLADLKAVEGISDALAQKLYDFFHERDEEALSSSGLTRGSPDQEILGSSPRMTVVPEDDAPASKPFFPSPALVCRTGA